MSARLQAPDIRMPEKESLVHGRFEFNDLNRLDVLLAVKQQQLHSVGIAREDGEVDSVSIDGSAQGVRSPGFDLERNILSRLESIGFSLRKNIGYCHDTSSCLDQVR